MASADELIREAQHALDNVSPGSTDERKNIARAKKCAMQIVRRFPHSTEASQARVILAQLDARDVPAQVRRTDRLRAILVSPAVVADDEWRNILQRFIALPVAKKNVLAGGLLLVAVFVPVFFLILIGLASLYALKPPLLKQHLLHVLNTLGSNK